MPSKKQLQVADTCTAPVGLQLVDVLRILPDAVIEKSIWERLERSDRLNLSLVRKDVRALAAAFDTTITFTSAIEAVDVHKLMSALQQHPGVNHLVMHLADLGSTSLNVAALHALKDEGLTNQLSVVTIKDGLGQQASSWSISTLLSALPCLLPRVTKLVVDVPLPSSSSPALKSWAHFQQLKQLTLMKGIDALGVECIAAVSSLEHLTIFSHTIQDEDVPRALSKLTCLHSLSVCWYVPYSYMSALSTLTGLTRLDWSNEPPEEEDPEQSADNAALAALSTLVNLQELHLDNLYLHDEGMQGVAAMTQLTHLSIQQLRLRDCPPGGARGLKLLEHDYYEVPPLQLLRLLGSALAASSVTTCTAWNVSCKANCCPVTHVSVQRIADSLRQLLPLYAADMQVDLYGGTQVELCGRTSEACPVRPLLCALEPAAPHLRVCTLSDMTLQRQDLEALVDSCPQVVKLKLDRCRLESGALMALLALPHLAELVVWSLQFVPLPKLYEAPNQGAHADAPDAGMMSSVKVNVAMFCTAWSLARSSSSGGTVHRDGDAQPNGQSHMRLSMPYHAKDTDLEEMLRAHAPFVTLC